MNSFKTLVFIISISSFTFFTSCSDDDSVPTNLEDFVGVFEVQEVDEFGDEFEYDLTISINGDRLVLDPLNDEFPDVDATANGTNFTIPSQVCDIEPDFPVTISGSGSIDGDNITYTYTLSIPGLGGITIDGTGTRN